MRRKIENDVHNIAKRVKKIDSGYEIYFNDVTKEYELHHKKQREDWGNGLLLVLPFERLDKRAVDYVLKTRACNVDIEHYSENLENENRARAERIRKENEDKTAWETKEIIKYVNRHSQKEWID